MTYYALGKEMSQKLKETFDQICKKWENQIDIKIQQKNTIVNEKSNFSHVSNNLITENIACCM